MAERHARRAARSAVLVVACLGGLAACASLQEKLEPPVVNLRALEPESIGLNSQVFRARLSVFNPNAGPLRISRGEMDLELAGVRAARGRTIEPFAVDAGAEKEVDIRVTTNLLRDGPALFSALSGGSSELTYALSGFVYVERRGADRLPFESKGILTVPSGQGGGKIPRPPSSDSSL